MRFYSCVLIDVRISHFSSRIKVCNLWFLFCLNVSKMTAMISLG